MDSIISIYGKRGSGKTVITANLGIAIASMGKKVLIVDGDIVKPALNQVFGMSKGSKGLPLIQDILLDSVKVRDGINRIEYGVDAIFGAADPDYSNIDTQKFRSIINEMSRMYDVILLDCPGEINRVTVDVISASDFTFIVANPEYSSLLSALKMKVLMRILNGQLAGIIINNIQKEDVVTGTQVGELIGSEVVSIIPADNEVKKSLEQKSPIMKDSPDSPASQAINKLATAVVEGTCFRS